MAANGKNKSGGMRGIFVILAAVVFVLGGTVFGQPWDGNGVEGDPYLIWDANDMQAIGADSNYWDAHFKLVADIDLSDYNGVGGNPLFNIIGSDPPFAGVFDGNGHTISNFTCTGDPYRNWGVFGGVSGPNAVIKNLGLIDPEVEGGNVCGSGRVGSIAGYLGEGTINGCYVEGGHILAGGHNETGGLVGESSGTISDCYVSGTDVNSVGGIVTGGLAGKNRGEISNCYVYGAGINAENNYGGGLVGYNYQGTILSCYAAENIITGGSGSRIGGLVGYNFRGAISNCHADGLIDGRSDAGGLVGYNQEGTIANCYSVGRVLRVDYEFGGLLGDNSGGTVSNSFWDVNSSGQAFGVGYGGDSNGVSGESTANMQMRVTFASAGWDFNTPIWTIDDGNDYPRLWFEEVFSTGRYGGGRGLPKDPYLIYDANDMQAIGANLIDWNKHFRLMADIDLSAYAGTSFNIIGERDYDSDYVEKPFIGIFDGNGHIISGFTYDYNGTDWYYSTGIFGAAKGAVIKNLGLVEPNVDGGVGYSVGSMVGFMEYGMVSNCYAEAGRICGDKAAGGLVGMINLSGTIMNCYSSARVSGDLSTGGLVGSVWAWEERAKVSDSYSVGSVAGGSYVGGLIGYSYDAEVYNCYSAGSVSGANDVGGLIGYADNSSYTKCFWDSDVNPDVNGIGNGSDPNVIGETTANMQAETTFTSAGWDFVLVWDICEGTNYPKLVWQISLLGDFGCPDGVDGIDLGVLCEEWLLEELSADVWPDGGDGFVDFLDWAILADGWGDTYDVFDLADFAGEWLKRGVTVADIAPYGGDGIVNMADFAALADNWLAGI